MRQTRRSFRPTTAVILLACAAFAQDSLTSILKMGYTDVAETKRKAEAGDLAAQLSLANTLAGQFRPADALPWYQKAAAQGSAEAIYKMGNILLVGGIGIPMDKSVKADPATGIQLIFLAATNRYTAAYYDMYKAYRDGIAVPKDIVQAYAWLQLDVDSAPGLLGRSVHQMELNRLALDVDVATSQVGKRLAAQYKSGHWPVLVLKPAAEPKPPTAEQKPVPVATSPAPPPPPKAPAKPQPNLVLSGIVMGQTPVAVINGKSLTVGETKTIVIKPQTYAVKCLSIDKNSVLVSVDGANDTHELHLR